MVVNTVNDGANISDWFRSIPIVTQYWFGATMALTFAGNIGIVDPSMLVWSWMNIKNKFELWRVVTSFCYAGPFAFPTVITICKCMCGIF